MKRSEVIEKMEQYIDDCEKTHELVGKGSLIGEASKAIGFALTESVKLIKQIETLD